MVKKIQLSFDDTIFDKLREKKDGQSWEDFLLHPKDIDLIHTKLHGLRMISNYKATIFEGDVNKIICERYKDTCQECKQKLEQLKNPPKKKGFLDDD